MENLDPSCFIYSYQKCPIEYIAFEKALRVVRDKNKIPAEQSCVREAEEELNIKIIAVDNLLNDVGEPRETLIKFESESDKFLFLLKWGS